MSCKGCKKKLSEKEQKKYINGLKQSIKKKKEDLNKSSWAGTFIQDVLGFWLPFTGTIWRAIQSLGNMQYETMLDYAITQAENGFCPKCSTDMMTNTFIE